MIPLSFRWAFVGGFAARTIDEPFRPIPNALESALFASIFATKTGQLMVGAAVGTAVRAASAGATAVASATVTGVVLGAAAGAVIGAAVGTATSSIIFGEAGKQKAIDFYTGQSGAKWYEYIPHYNGYRIVRHYATEAIE